MNKDVIGGVIRVLKYKGRGDLANLLKNSSYRIEESSTYGSYLNSVLSTFEIYSPYKEYKQLNQLGEEEKKEILDAVLEIIPPKPHSIEINWINFLYDMELDGDKFENEINTCSDFNSKSIYDFKSIYMNAFWNAFKAYIEKIETDEGYFNTFNGRWIRTCDGGGYWEIDTYSLVRSMIQELGKGEYPLKNQPENKIIIKLVEFFSTV